MCDIENFEWQNCKLNYRGVGDEYKKQLEYIDKICGISKHIGLIYAVPSFNLRKNASFRGVEFND